MSDDQDNTKFPTTPEATVLPADDDRRIAAWVTGRGHGRETVGLAWMNLANGDFKACESTPELLDAELGRIAPAELVCAEQRTRSRWNPPDWTRRSAGCRTGTSRPTARVTRCCAISA